MPQHAVGTPLLGEFDDRPWQVAIELLQFRFEARKEREGVGGRAGESGDNLIVGETPELTRCPL